MTIQKLDVALLFAALIAAIGCQRGPVLTSRQVEQVFDTQEHMVEQQASLSRARDNLEVDRRTWEQRERNDPIIAKSIETTGILIACCLPLIVLVLLVGKVSHKETEDAGSERLLAETLSGEVRHIIEQDANAAHKNLPTG